MAVNLVKGGNVSLTQLAPDTDVFNVLLGWKARSELRLDAFCFLLDADGTVYSDEDAVYYSQPSSEDEAVEYLGTNSSSNTAASFAAEAFRVELSEISPDVTKLVFAVGIYDPLGNDLTFAQVSATSLVIVDTDSNSRLVSYELRETMPAYKAMILGELYRYKGQWKFRALGDGFNDGVCAMFDAYGVDLLPPEAEDTVRALSDLAAAVRAVRDAQDEAARNSSAEDASASAVRNSRSTVPQQAAPTPQLPPALSSSTTADRDDRSLGAASSAKTSDHSLCLAVIGGLAIGYVFMLRLIELGLFVLFLLSPIILIVWLI